MKIFIIRFVGFQFDDTSEYDQNGVFIVKAEGKTEALDKFITFLVDRSPALSVILERNFDEVNEIWGGPNSNVDIVEVPNDDDIITYDLGGYYVN